MTGAAALLLAARVVAAPQDHDYRAALDLLYDGRAAEAQARLVALEHAHPDDPVPVYLEALALAWVVEQRPDSTAQDRALEQAADRAWTLADGRLRADPADVRARFARGAASGVRSRFALFRQRRSEAARAAAQMREDLLAARAQDPGDADVLFGLGLYDYYADVLPRFARLLRFLNGLPGGNRARGLAAIEEAARSATLHDVEARVQLYEIRAFYEHDPDGALADIEEVQRRHAGWPLWGLERAEHLRDRLGAYAESEAVARPLLRGRPDAPDPGEAARALARLSIAASLLLDLRPADVREVLLPIADGVAGFPALGAQAQVLLGHAREEQGDRRGAATHYRTAAAGADRGWRKRAEAALAHPMPAAEVKGRQLLAAARRASEARRSEEACARAREVLLAWPASREAALVLADDLLRSGDGEGVRVPEVEEAQGDEPPWLVPWSALLRAHQADLAGRRGDAVKLYKEVLTSPRRRADLRAAAAAGLQAPFTRASAPGAGRPRVRTGPTSIPTATGAAFLEVSRFSTVPSTG